MLDELNPFISTEPRAAFVISDNSDPVMTIMPDGRFIVKGQEVETSEEVRDIFAAWCNTGNVRVVASVTAENLRLRAALEQYRGCLLEYVGDVASKALDAPK